MEVLANIPETETQNTTPLRLATLLQEVDDNTARYSHNAGMQQFKKRLEEILETTWEESAALLDRGGAIDSDLRIIPAGSTSANNKALVRVPVNFAIGLMYREGEVGIAFSERIPEGIKAPALLKNPNPILTALARAVENKLDSEGYYFSNLAKILIEPDRISQEFLAQAIDNNIAS